MVLGAGASPALGGRGGAVGCGPRGSSFGRRSSRWRAWRWVCTTSRTLSLAVCWGCSWGGSGCWSSPSFGSCFRRFDEMGYDVPGLSHECQNSETHVPEISRFFGIAITMYYADHQPPHFHARYAGQRALVAIGTLAIMHGELSPRVHGMVVEWAAAHQDDLREAWHRA